MEFYNTVLQRVTAAVEHGRRQLQALVRQQPHQSGPSGDRTRRGWASPERGHVVAARGQ